MSLACRGLQRSHAGPNAAAALSRPPSAPEFVIPPARYRTLILERLQLPLDVTEVTCETCRAELDTYGRHRAACGHCGRLKTRSVAGEVELARICRKAGAQVQTNMYLQRINFSPPTTHERRVDVLATGLPCYDG